MIVHILVVALVEESLTDIMATIVGTGCLEAEVLDAEGNVAEKPTEGEEKPEDIKKYADAVNIPRSPIIEADAYTERQTDVLKQMKDANLTMFVHYLGNKYVTLTFDYFADPYVELVTYIQAIKTKGGHAPCG